MANFYYNPAAVAIASAGLDLTTDLVMLLVNAGSDAENDRTVATISGFSPLNEHADASYTRKLLTNITIQQDDVNNRAEIHADDVVWPALAGSTVVAGVLYKKVGAGTFGDDATNIPIGWVDSGGFPKSPQGDAFTVQINAEGLAHLLA